MEKLALRRSLSAADLLSLLRHESIAPSALLGRELDEVAIEALVSEQANILLVCETSEPERTIVAAMFFHFQEPGVYEVHTMALPSARGRPFVYAVREALNLLFLCSECMELYTRVPEGNRGALGLVRLIGGRKEWSVGGTWYYALRWNDWLWKQSGEASALMLRCAQELIFNGLIVKALVLYNRWARLSGRPQMEIVLQQPLVVRIGSELFQIDFSSRKMLLIEQEYREPEQLALPLPDLLTLEPLGAA